ncbi:S-layer homology domain-containing protein [Acutalibacter sp. 1XD8-36]|nr:S-layer homology domain-containing protein [Acutalibacter sp. 1XD8-36]
MVVALVPMSALAEDEDVGQELNITVDTYRATRNGNDYEVTVWDSNDVTIAWAPIPGTTLKLVTGGNNPDVVLDLPHKLYLAENANVVGENTYTVTLRETVGSADPVDHTLKITVASSIPDDDATLAAIRVDNTSGNYAFGYLTGTAIPGYISDVTATGIEAHAIGGVIDNVNETVTITLPFGMKPADVGMDASLDGAASHVFAPTSVHANSVYKYIDEKSAEITVTAKTGVVNRYKVSFEHETIFESFTNATNLDELTEVKDGLPTLKVEEGEAAFVPRFKTTDNVKRIMGTSGDAEVSGTDDDQVELDFSSTTIFGEWMKSDQVTTVDQDHMLKLITSGHANWGFEDGVKDLVYLLVRTKANPVGAWLKIELDEPAPEKTKAVITELQVDNTESKTGIASTERTINITVDNTHSFAVGNTEARDPADPATGCYIHVTTDKPAELSIPDQTMAASSTDKDKGDGWWSSSFTTAGTRHFIDGINAKSGEFTLRVTSEDDSYIDYTVKLTAAKTQSLGLKRVELRNSKGALVAASTVDAKNSFDLKVPYACHAGKATTAAIDDPLNGLYLYVYPDAGAVVVPGNNGVTGTKVKTTTVAIGSTDGTQNSGNNTNETPFENSITVMSKVWVNQYTLDKDGAANSGTAADLATFDSILNLTVSNGKNTSKEVYQVKLKRNQPAETAIITGIEANKALDSDYIYSVATTLGTQLVGHTDIGQAYVGAVDIDGNKLLATVDQAAKTIKIEVPHDWTKDDVLYLTDVDFTGFNYARIASDGSAKASTKTLDPINQEDQSHIYTGPLALGFDNLTTSAGSATKYNTLYVYSEAKYYAGDRTPTAADINYDWLNANAVAYKMYVVKGTENTGRTLTGVEATNGATAVFRNTYDDIKLTVPGSYNWTAYRKDNSKDFKLKFSTSTGALVIDKGQYEANEVIAADSIKDNGTKYDDTRNGTTTLENASKAEYKKQLNLHNQIDDETTFFVMDGELYIYDELTGKETRVTGVGDNFTNSNWGEIKTKQAEIQVYNAAQRSSMNYRLDLVVGAKSNSNQITSLKVGETSATISGSEIAVTMPADSEKEQALTIEHNGAAVAVNGERYLESLPVDLTKPVTIVVTAEDGTEATYTLTVTFSDDTPDPDKPSSKFEDLDKVTNDTMRDFVKRAIDMGIMGSTSTTANVFSPKAIVSRKDFAVIIARADLMANNEDITNTKEADERLEELYGGEDAFDDIANINPVQKAAIKYCTEKSYISGDGKGSFNPNGSIERQAAAIILAKWRGLEVDEENTENVNNVKDWKNVANWAKPYVNAVMADGLMSGTGNGNFTPAGEKGTVNREQTAVMLVKVFDKKYPSFN